ncbi:unnamed protein product [Cochlearia groenlandica]
MEVAKRSSLVIRKESKRKHTRLVRSIVAYLKSDAYLFSPLISDSPPFATEIETHPPLGELPLAGFDELGTKRVNKKKKEKKRRMLEKAKEYLKSDCYMYGPMISSSKLGSSLKGELQITNLVAVEVSKSATTMREDIRSYKHLLSGNTEQALRNGRIDSTKGAELD